MTYLIEISPEYMAQIESEMTQPTYVKPATTIANPTLFKLHHEQGGLEFVDIEEEGFGGFGGFGGGNNFGGGGGKPPFNPADNPRAGLKNRDTSEFGGSKMFIQGGGSFQTLPSKANNFSFDDEDFSRPPQKPQEGMDDVPF